ncbi:MAG: hypothetical protein ABJF10_22370 [Chthoniobacter sp.]|uniref:hypothetical protein n=1 Tax=Chthoniobacter sp. TaxID=2510640 RepID=UPI0032A8B17B
MIATQTPQCSLPGGRPAFRVLCAWCEQPIEQTTPVAASLSGTSHGICAPCAQQHFGLDLERIAEGQLCA